MRQQAESCSVPWSIPGKLSEWIDPQLDCVLSSGWIVRLFVQGVPSVPFLAREK